jgi:hypothetical protein
MENRNTQNSGSFVDRSVDTSGFIGWSGRHFEKALENEDFGVLFRCHFKHLVVQL